MTPSKLDPARARACTHLGKLAHGCPDLFPIELDRAGLNPRENALANVIVEFATSRWLTLRWLIEQQLNQPFTELQPQMRGVLLAGATQLVFLDGVPAYAAINESVEWAKQKIRPGAGRMVNAVLRRVSELVGETPERTPSWTMARNEIPLSDGSAIVLTHGVMPEDERFRFAVATSNPTALLASMLRTFPEDQVRAIAWHNMAQPPTVLNIGHATEPPVGDDFEPHETPGFAVYKGDHLALCDLLNVAKDLWAQDVASAQAVRLAAEIRPAPALILDLCAGLGTKTRQLAAVFPDATIIATDTNEARGGTLRAVFQGHDRVQIVEPDATHPWLDKADLILLDVPCSNTGTLARRVEARYRATDDGIATMVAIQKQILADAIPLLAPAGAILYSTCSIDPRENHAQAAWVSSQHHLRIVQELTMLPAGAPGEPQTRYTDGSYSAVLSRA